MPYTTPLPAPAQWVIRTLGAALVAAYLGTMLGLLFDLAFGPFERERLPLIFLAFAVACFAGVMWLLVRRAARAAERERLGLAPPPAGASLLLAGILALVFAAAALHMLLEPDAEDRRLMLQAASMFLAGGTAAVIVGVRRIRMRRQWRLQSQATARPGD